MGYEFELREKADTRPKIGAMMPKQDPGLLSTMEHYLAVRGLDAPTALKNGWYPSRNAGDEHPRIVIPATNSSGKGYWQARAMDKNVEPRYQSPSVPRGDSVIQVWPLHKEWLPVLIICEGPADALAGAGCGIRSVALMGNTPSEEVLDMVATLTMDAEIVSYFADRDALEEAITFLQRCLKRGIKMSISDPSPYKDLAAVPVKRRQQMLDMYTLHCKK